MRTARLHFDRLGLTWHRLRQKVSARRTSNPGCAHLRSIWRRLRGPVPRVLLEGSRYCLEECLDAVLHEALDGVRSGMNHGAVPHRIPLGLLLLSRQQLTAEQLRVGLEAQRSAGQGRLGEWLQSLGFVTEEKITAALARQWSCPVLRAGPLPRSSRSPQIPLTLLERFAMIPVNFVEATSTLHVAFGDGIDHSVLYAIEKMTASHTEPCMAALSLVRANLSGRMLHRGEYEAAFDDPADTAECSRIVRSYCARLSATEIRVAGCGAYTWVRLFRVSRPPMDLLFRVAVAARSLSQPDRSLKFVPSLPIAAVAGD